MPRGPLSWIVPERDLHGAVIVARRIHHCAAFLDGLAGGLFAHYVLTGLAGMDGHQRVPMIRGGNDDRIYVFAIKEVAVILIKGRLDLCDLLGDTVEMVLIDVA